MTKYDHINHPHQARPHHLTRGREWNFEHSRVVTLHNKNTSNASGGIICLVFIASFKELEVDAMATESSCPQCSQRDPLFELPPRWELRKNCPGTQTSLSVSLLKIIQNRYHDARILPLLCNHQAHASRHL